MTSSGFCLPACLLSFLFFLSLYSFLPFFLSLNVFNLQGLCFPNQPQKLRALNLCSSCLYLSCATVRVCATSAGLCGTEDRLCLLTSIPLAKQYLSTFIFLSTFNMGTVSIMLGKFLLYCFLLFSGILCK